MTSPAGPVRVLQWAQEHGEVGGVLSSHTQLTRRLRADGHEVRYVDTGSAARAARALPGAVRHRSLHLLHLTRLWRAIVLAPVFAVLPGRTVLVLHSGSVGRQLDGMGRVERALLRLALHAYDEVWAVNDEIAARLPAGLAGRVTVVTPYVADAPGDAPPVPREAHLLVVTTNAGLPHYNADLAVDAVEQVREVWPDARLQVLAYGHDGPELAALRDRVRDLPWVEVGFDAPPQQVDDVLRRAGTFLRPTAWDGDSVVVREALAAGARVVATDTAPRPAGVVLAAPDPASLAEAVLGGGRVSDGRGLVSVGLAEAAAEALARMRRQLS